MIAEVGKSVARFPAIPLAEMGKIRLMNRIDTKFVLSADKLLALLDMALGEYAVQETDGERMPRYATAYFDTRALDMYTMHETGRRRREKIRVRTYVDSGLSFLEVKNKNNKGRTDKKRMEIAGRDAVAGPAADDFLRRHAWFGLDTLAYTLENSFRRITLVNRARTERLTIDLGVSFHNLGNDARAELGGVAIVEVKRDGLCPSPVMDMLRRLRVQPQGFSKYVMGMAVTDPTLRRNRLKERLRSIERLNRTSSPLNTI